MTLRSDKLGKLCLAVLLLEASATAAEAAGIGFRNDTKLPIIVQGASLVNNMLRRGQPLLIHPGKIGWDNNLPPGIRQVTIYDATQPSRILYRDPPIKFQSQDLFFAVRPLPGNPGRVILVPDKAP